MAEIYQDVLSKRDAMDLKRYTWNLFAFPFGYFEERTAEELNVSETVRNEIIRMQAEYLEGVQSGNWTGSEEREKRMKQEFLEEFGWEDE